MIYFEQDTAKKIAENAARVLLDYRGIILDRGSNRFICCFSGVKE